MSKAICDSEGHSSRFSLELPKFLRHLGVLQSVRRTFFTPVGELGATYHEMHLCLGTYGEFPYEEHFPTSHELNQLED